MFISLHRYHLSNSASATANLQRPLNQKLAETIIQKTAQLLAAELFTARPRHIRGCCFCSRWDGLSSPTSKRKKSLCIFKYEKSQVKLEVKNLPIMSQPGRDKLGQQCYEPSKDLVSQWAPERARTQKQSQDEPDWLRMSRNEHEWKSEAERARVSQKEFDSGLKVPCSQLIMNDNEMEIGS